MSPQRVAKSFSEISETIHREKFDARGSHAHNTRILFERWAEVRVEKEAVCVR
jgi:hypothetical protein